MLILNNSKKKRGALFFFKKKIIASNMGALDPTLQKHRTWKCATMCSEKYLGNAVKG